MTEVLERQKMSARPPALALCTTTLQTASDPVSWGLVGPARGAPNSPVRRVRQRWH